MPESDPPQRNGLSPDDVRHKPGENELFSVYYAGGKLCIYHNNPVEGEPGDYFLHNMLGQLIWKRTLTGTGYHQADVNCSSGIYIISLKTNDTFESKKILIETR